MNRLQGLSIDHHSAELRLREALSFTETQVREELSRLKKAGVEEAVLLSTCNRTELYLYGEEDSEPGALLCADRQVDIDFYSDLFQRYEGEAAVHHLMEVACGLRSQILCEDQIITQVKTAAAVAREEKASGPVLETLFRMAVTAAKKAKTEVQVRAVPRSSAAQAVELLRSVCGELRDKKALVIGNGEIGRLCAGLLRDAGCAVTVTLRTYRHGETVVPFGCRTVDYKERVEEIGRSDFVVSATTSPHFTVTKAMVEGLARVPAIFVDLAVPRDIEPEVGAIPRVSCYNIDDIGSDGDDEILGSLQKIGAVIEKYEGQFRQWLEIHGSAEEIQSVKHRLVEKVKNALIYKEEVSLSEDPVTLIELAVEKAVDSLIFAAKDEISGDFIRLMDEALKKQEDRQ